MQYLDSIALLENIFLGIFTLEMLIKIGAIGVVEYVQDSNNLFDGFIVVVGLIGVIVGSDSPLAILRLFRMFKLGRTVKALKNNKDVQALLDATMGITALWALESAPACLCCCLLYSAFVCMHRCVCVDGIFCVWQCD